MKKTLLLSLGLAGALASSVLAQGTPPQSGTTFTATPQTTSVAAGGSFNVDFSLTGTAPPTSFFAYDLYVVTDAANSGLFTITASTPTGPLNATGPTLPAGGDPISTPAATGFVQNGVDLGYSGPTQTAPYNLSLQTLTIAVSSSAAPGVYTFSTSTFTNAGQYYSDVADASTGDVYEVQPGTFQITVTAAAVPEPATWSLLGLGGLGSVGMTLLRRRRS